MTELSEKQLIIEKVMKNIFYNPNSRKSFNLVIKNFALNLQDIWDGSSANDLIPENQKYVNKPSIVIGRGPSLKKNNHLKILADSNFDGNIVCCDGALKSALDAGVTPDKFPNFYVVTIDPGEKFYTFYDHEIIDHYGHKIKGFFSTVIHPKTVSRIKNNNISFFWLHSLLDYNEGEKSFNSISAIMTRSKKHITGLPAIQTGGNVGTSAWFISWKILKSNLISLIGIDHGWLPDDPFEKIITHGNTSKSIGIKKDDETYKKFFPTVHNTDLDCDCVLDPIFNYYRTALIEFIQRSPSEIQTINCTEGGSIFGQRIKSMKFYDFLLSNRK